MTLPHPVVFHSALSSDRLELISRWLLEEWYATEDDLTRPTDNSYTKGCTTFGRQRNRIISEVQSRQHPWLGLSNNGYDIVLTIEGIPVRFSNDDPANPTKDAVLTTNRYQMSFLEFSTTGEPGRFCFIVDRGRDGISELDRGRDEMSEPRVEFLGFTPSGDIACRWVYNTVRVFEEVTRSSLVEAVDVAKPPVTPKRRDADSIVDEAMCDDSIADEAM